MTYEIDNTARNFISAIVPSVGIKSWDIVYRTFALSQIK
jgi:hypothetical protein